eukprot:jgi/Galph1/1178/GphlegSOOS_G6100.1
MTACFIKFLRLFRSLFALEIYELCTHLKLLFYYPLVLAGEASLSQIKRLLDVFKRSAAESSCESYRVIAEFRFPLPFLRKRTHQLHFELTEERDLNRNKTVSEDVVNWSNHFVNRRLLLYDAETERFKREIEQNNLSQEANDGKDNIENCNVTKFGTSTDSFKSSSAMISRLLKAKDSIERYLDETIRDIKQIEKEDYESKDIAESLDSHSEAVDISKRRYHFLYSLEFWIKVESLAGRIAMPALLLCFLREYIEPGHPMLTSQLLSLLPLQVYGDVAPSGYNPYVRYISGLLKTAAETKFNQFTQSVFDLIISLSFLKVSMIIDLLKILGP